jgi:steroid delta-isomerase-like uncharacterized protein
MKKVSQNSTIIFAAFTIIGLSLISCAATDKEKGSLVEANKKIYTNVWDEVLNKRNLNMINDSNFTKDAVLHVSPKDIVGVENIKIYYGEFLKGFTNIKFTIQDIVGEDEKLVKQWNFAGTHTGEFFGIAATGKQVSLDGSTVIRMSNGKIAEERDYYDNMEFMTQLGLVPPAGQ